MWAREIPAAYRMNSFGSVMPYRTYYRHRYRDRCTGVDVSKHFRALVNSYRQPHCGRLPNRERQFCFWKAATEGQDMHTGSVDSEAFY